MNTLKKNKYLFSLLFILIALNTHFSLASCESSSQRPNLFLRSEYSEEGFSQENLGNTVITGNNILVLQQFLKNFGLYRGKTDGLYGEVTAQAVDEWHFINHVNHNHDYDYDYDYSSSPLKHGRIINQTWQWAGLSTSCNSELVRDSKFMEYLNKAKLSNVENCLKNYDAPYLAAEINNVIPLEAFLSLIGYAEGTGNCYNYMFSYKRFTDFSKHPNKEQNFEETTSTAAGRYQFLNKTWKIIAKVLNLKDFSPHNQDLGAIYLIKRRRVTQLEQVMDELSFKDALDKMSWEWASFPPSRYGQRGKTFEQLWKKYQMYLYPQSLSEL